MSSRRRRGRVGRFDGRLGDLGEVEDRDEASRRAVRAREGQAAAVARVVRVQFWRTRTTWHRDRSRPAALPCAAVPRLDGEALILFNLESLAVLVDVVSAGRTRKCGLALESRRRVRLLLRSGRHAVREGVDIVQQQRCTERMLARRRVRFAEARRRCRVHERETAQAVERVLTRLVAAGWRGWARLADSRARRGVPPWSCRGLGRPRRTRRP